MTNDATAPRVRVLLAEDDAVNRQVAVALLRRRGYEVDAVADGRQAVDAVRAKRYDVVLMDIQMPALDGREATRRIRALPGLSELPIVALTGQDLPDERRRCSEAGMSDFLPKPVEPEDLFEAVERWTVQASDRPRELGGGDTVNEAAQTPPVDVEAFRAMMREGGIEEIVESTLEMYVEESAPAFAALEEAMASGETELIERRAHGLKSSSSTIRADGFSELLRRLERLGRDGDLEEARRLFPEVAKEYRAVMDYLAG